MISNPEKPLKTLSFFCKKCDFLSFNKKDFVRHTMTKKHILDKNQSFSIEKTPKNPIFCLCGKEYKDNSGLWRHKKKCNLKIETNKEPTDKELIMLLIKENSEMKNLVLEVCKNIKPTNITNINKTFNLNVFLNEECKDAMNIMDFVDSLKLQLSDLETVGKTGFVNGISNIIVKNLKALDIHKRPVHCSDLKREVLYIKDEDKWNKENEEYNKMKQLIQQITHKNIKKIPDWVNENPLCKDSSSIKNDEYMNLLSNCMSGDCNEEQLTNMNKIISKVAKEVLIEKIN